jgi:small subunit ribosomal protein S5
MTEKKKPAGARGGEKGGRGVRPGQDEFAETVLQIRRVAKVIKGGRRLAFSALVVVGDKAGKVGLALAKSREVAGAITKALRRARKNMIDVPMYKTTIPYTVQANHGSSCVLLKSASHGTGVIAGGAVRAIIEAAGIQDILAKSLGSPNPCNVARAALSALQKLCSAKDIARLRGKKIFELVGGEPAVGESDVQS